MKKFKLSIVTFCLCCLLAVLTACGSGSKESKSLVLGHPTTVLSLFMMTEHTQRLLNMAPENGPS